MNVPDKLIVHHSASPLSTTWRNIEGWHLDRGFEGIGYHAVLQADLSWYYARPLWVFGAHDKGENRDSIGVCVVGNNRTKAHRWTGRMTRELVRYMESCWMLFGPSFRFEMHRENEPDSTPTACPGLTDGEWADLLASVTAPWRG